MSILRRQQVPIDGNVFLLLLVQDGTVEAERVEISESVEGSVRGGVDEFGFLVVVDGVGGDEVVLLLLLLLLGDLVLLSLLLLLLLLLCLELLHLLKLELKLLLALELLLALALLFEALGFGLVGCFALELHVVVGGVGEVVDWLLVLWRHLGLWRYVTGPH